MYGCHSNQIQDQTSLSFLNSHYNPVLKLITSGNPFKLFIKMKENGGSSLVVKTVVTREAFFFKWAGNKEKTWNQKGIKQSFMQKW